MASAMGGQPVREPRFNASLGFGSVTTAAGHTAREVSDEVTATSDGQSTEPGSVSLPVTSHAKTRRRSPRASGIDSPENADSNDTSNQDPAVSEVPKARRVRTGCLTCRERHLKCDEGTPRCQNCCKSDRICRRGVRLNFIDTQTVAPPHSLVQLRGALVMFQDESRGIASEYVGGLERYPPLDEEEYLPNAECRTAFEPATNVSTLHTESLQTPEMPQYTMAAYLDTRNVVINHQGSYPHIGNQHVEPVPHVKTRADDMDTRDGPYLDDPEEVFLMQVFVEEVGLWMDSMDAAKHFTHILPFHALDDPMLLKAFMACGARHLALVNPSYDEEKPLHYYEAASRDLLTHLQDPDRDSVLCATTAVILNVYEVMCARAMHRMNHIAGARALIKECRWDARSAGLGGACFWLNVGMELLSCLHFNWTLAWDPDTWGVDLNLQPSQSSFAGGEDTWTHRIVYICAKIANFRSSIPHFQRLDPATQDLQLPHRCQEWEIYNSWCDQWARAVPRSMKPFGYLQPWQTAGNSAFPEVWIIHRSAIVGRLFYHTARILLAKIHPLEPEFGLEMRTVQQSHARDICGIIAHCKDRGAATVSIRCLAIAAECLTDRQAQEEVLEIFDKIIKETGWRVDFIRAELQETWGWTVPELLQHQQNHTTASGASSSGSGSLMREDSALNSSAPIAPRQKMMQEGIVNPTMASADFSMANHPYQNHYVAPHRHSHQYY